MPEKSVLVPCHLRVLALSSLVATIVLVCICISARPHGLAFITATVDDIDMQTKEISFGTLGYTGSNTSLGYNLPPYFATLKSNDGEMQCGSAKSCPAYSSSFPPQSYYFRRISFWSSSYRRDYIISSAALCPSPHALQKKMAAWHIDTKSLVIYPISAGLFGLAFIFGLWQCTRHISIIAIAFAYVFALVGYFTSEYVSGNLRCSLIQNGIHTAWGPALELLDVMLLVLMLIYIYVFKYHVRYLTKRETSDATMIVVPDDNRNTDDCDDGYWRSGGWFSFFAYCFGDDPVSRYYAPHLGFSYRRRNESILDLLIDDFLE